MKQIDRLLLQSFVGPFFVAFAIALFVFLMQYLWVYIDEIIGKGAGLLLIAELVGYLSVSMMPLALPVAVLIASVMTMGTLAEHYELSSMKSAGIPLWRVMAPLMLCGVAIAAFSFLCSNHLIPVANLKARTRLYDIRKQKPSLSLEEGSFNDDFQGFSIRIGEKADEGGGLRDVMLFRQGAALRGRLESVTAESGRMHVTPDDRYFVLELERGYQYQEPDQEVSVTRRTRPFVRTRFAAYRKTFDLSEFEIDRTDEDAFQNHQGMLSVRQLRSAIDSIGRIGDERRDRLAIEVGRFLYPMRRLDQAKQDSLDRLVQDSLQRAADLAFAQEHDPANSTATKSDPPAGEPGAAQPPTDAAPAGQAGAEPDGEPSMLTEPAPFDAGNFARERAIAQARRAFDDRRAEEEWEERAGPSGRLGARAAGTVAGAIDSTNRSYVHYLTRQPAYKHATYLDRALQFARSIQSYTEGSARRLEAQQTSYSAHVYELHLKFSFATSCFVFLFVGAPLGAVIRKGGFGYPVLASIMLFATFIVLNIMCKKLMSSFAIGPVAAAWVPTSVVFPIGIFLTYAAMNDRKFSLPTWTTESRAARWSGRLYRGLRRRMGFDTGPEASADITT